MLSMYDRSSLLAVPCDIFRSDKVFVSAFLSVVDVWFLRALNILFPAGPLFVAQVALLSFRIEWCIDPENGNAIDFS